MAPHILLEEIGLPFELKLVQRDSGEHRSAAYLRLNPNGLIPVLIDGDQVLYETAAILLHLADSHPQAGLVPPLATPERAQFYKWLIWLTNTLQPALNAYFYPDRWVNAGNIEGAAQVKVHAQARAGSWLDQLEAQLASHGGPWLLGDSYSAVDAMAFMLCRWTRGFERPAHSLPRLGAYLQRVLDRPAVQRMWVTEQLPQPGV